MTQKAIGATFAQELMAAGLIGLPFSWGADGSLTFGGDLTAAQKAAVEAVYEAHVPASTLSIEADQARATRDALIAATDYLLMADYPITVEALAPIKVYRQALRDITAQVEFPQSIRWPVTPQLPDR